MGMGEPMLNLDEVLAAARRLPDVGITHRRTTISTVGWLPGLKRFVDEVDEPIRLALSLHAPDDELRSKIMPVNDTLPAARRARRVPAPLRRDEPPRLRRVRDARRRERLAGAGARSSPSCSGRDDFKVNLIPYNPTGMYDGSSRDAHRRVQGRARPRARARDGAADARPRHRGGVRAAGGGAEGAPDCCCYRRLSLDIERLSSERTLTHASL